MAQGMVDGTDDSQGVDQILSNIGACLLVVDAVRTTLGPKGMDKIVVDQNGAVTISNDGATILSKLEIVHPAAQILTAIACAQDAEVGDGTTSVVILAGELLKMSKTFIEDGVYAGIIAKGFMTAARKALEIIRNASVSTKIGGFDNASGVEFLKQCAKVSMSSKLICPYRDLFADIVVGAVLAVADIAANVRGSSECTGSSRVFPGDLGDTRGLSDTGRSLNCAEKMAENVRESSDGAGGVRVSSGDLGGTRGLASDTGVGNKNRNSTTTEHFVGNAHGTSGGVGGARVSSGDLVDTRGLSDKTRVPTTTENLVGGDRISSKCSVGEALSRSTTQTTERNTPSSRINLKQIGIKKITGGTMKESSLVHGIAFKKTFSYAGFEMQPKRYENPKIALLNVELELKAERSNAEIRIQSVDEYQRIVDAEWKILYDKLDAIVKSGAKVVLSRLVIGDVATQYFADRDIFCAGRVAEEDMERMVMSCGGSILSVLDEIREIDLGMVDLFEEVQIGEERYNIFTGGRSSKACTILLRGCGDQFLEEVERALHDSLMVVKKAIQYKSVVGGAGAIEMHMSRLLKEYALTVHNKEQLIIAAFARALEVIPRQLCQNAGVDSSFMLNSLRTEHSKGNMWAGVDLDNDCVRDTLKDCLWEPSMIKINEISSATEAACIILTADETIKNAKRDASIAKQ